LKHLESIFLAAVIGAVTFYALNHIGEPVTTPDSKAIETGAIIGATVQVILRMTGVS
jgi:hypothetical protein